MEKVLLGLKKIIDFIPLINKCLENKKVCCAIVIILLFIIIIFLCPCYHRSIPYPENGIISQFKTGSGGYARNVFGGTFSITTDSELNEASTCWYSLEKEKLEMTKDGPETNYFMRLNFILKPKPEKTAYVGVFTSFSFPPSQNYDVSKFHAISIKLRVPEELRQQTGTRVVIALATDNSPKIPGHYNWCEYEILMQRINTRWTGFTISFSQLHSPNWSPISKRREFDPQKVFQFILAIRSNSDVHGYIDVDDIKFVK